MGLSTALYAFKTPTSIITRKSVSEGLRIKGFFRYSFFLSLISQATAKSGSPPITHKMLSQ